MGINANWTLDAVWGGGPLGSHYYLSHKTGVYHIDRNDRRADEMLTLADFGVKWDRVDAAFTSVKNGNRVFFIKGRQYTTWNIDTKTNEGIGHMYGWNFPWAWDSIDAALRIDWWYPSNYIFFFKGPYYVVFNEDTETVSSILSLTNF